MIDVFGVTLTHTGVASAAFWATVLGVGVSLSLIRAARPVLLNRTRWMLLAAALLLLLASLSIASASAYVATTVAWGFVLVALGAAGAGCLVGLGVFSLLELVAPKRRRGPALAQSGNQRG